MKPITIRYSAKRPDGTLAVRDFTLEEIEIGWVRQWVSNENVKQAEIKRELL